MAADTAASVAHGSIVGAPTPPAPRNGTTHNPELYDLLHALEAMRAGDFSVRLSSEPEGTLGKIAVVFNEIVAANQNMAQQLERIGKSVGEQGRTRQRV